MSATTNKETDNTHRGNREVNFRRGDELRVSWSEQKDFKGETPKLNAVLSLITKRLYQGVTFQKFQDVLNKFIKADDIVEIITVLNDSVMNFDTKHMPGDLTEKG